MNISDSDSNLLLSEQPELRLPRQIRCSAHTLNLCIIGDMIRAINNDTVLSAIPKDVMPKYSTLWKTAIRPKSAEMIDHTFGPALKRSGETRWNSLYDSLRQILNIKDKMADLAKFLRKKNALRETNFVHIEEHIKCTAPIAEAIDILQGDNISYGILLPCLFSLRRKLTKLAESEWKFCKPISMCLRGALQTRFQDYLETR